MHVYMYIYYDIYLYVYIDYIYISTYLIYIYIYIGLILCMRGCILSVKFLEWEKSSVRETSVDSASLV